MIKKIEMPEMDETYKSAMFAKVLGNKINELVDYVNTLCQEHDIHEEQIDKLQMMIEPHKCEPVENGKSSKMEQDPYAEQRGWVGILCRFWDDNSKITKHFGILTRIDETAIVPYEAENGFWYCACEPIKPTDSIIYKGE